MKSILYILIGFLISTGAIGQNVDTLLNFNPDDETTDVYFRTRYWDFYESYTGESDASEIQCGIDMKLNYYADTPDLLKKVKETFTSDSTSWHCFCGWDIEIYVVKMDTLYSEDKYVFCCNELFTGHIIDSLKVAKLLNQLDTVEVVTMEYNSLEKARKHYFISLRNPEFADILTYKPLWINYDGYFQFSLITNYLHDGFNFGKMKLDSVKVNDYKIYGGTHKYIADKYSHILNVYCKHDSFLEFKKKFSDISWIPFNEIDTYILKMHWKRLPDTLRSFESSARRHQNIDEKQDL
ncbi:MAG: hypothetical protein JXB00_08170 [Bacteroidales bacterium]|nr:hypothetical protein [Bacteroidales bacterium]